MTRHLLSSITLGAVLSLAATTAHGDRGKTCAKAAGAAESAALTADAIVARHVAALGGDALLRASTSLQYTVTGTKEGKPFTKTVTLARPDRLRIDFTIDGVRGAKGYDGKVAWVKQADQPAAALSAEDTAAMAQHAQFDEPLLDYARKGTRVTLVGKVAVAGAPAYQLEVATRGGEVEQHFIDAASFLLVKTIARGKDRDGKPVEYAVRYGDYKRVGGRMLYHAMTWTDDAGVERTSTISKVTLDGKVPASLFAMPQ